MTKYGGTGTAECTEMSLDKTGGIHMDMLLLVFRNILLDHFVTRVAFRRFLLSCHLLHARVYFLLAVRPLSVDFG
eukprot:SAG22_NODE_5756_length_958_cov_1.967404_1_plen_74_part_10